MAIAVMLALLLQNDPLTRLGTVTVFEEFALGRNGEPLDGDIYLSPDGKTAIARGPRTQSFRYIWNTANPRDYKPFTYLAAYDPKTKQAVIHGFSLVAARNSEVAWPSHWLTFGGCEVEAVISVKRVIVKGSGRDRTGVGRTVIGIVTPGEARGRVLLYLRREDSRHPHVGPDGTTWVYDPETQRYKEAKVGGKPRTIPKGAYFKRYYTKGNFEIDRKTGARTEVLQHNDRTQYWGDHLIVTRENEFFLWDRSNKKLVSLGPAMPVMGKDYTGKRIAFRTDTRKGVVRQHKMLIVDR